MSKPTNEEAQLTQNTNIELVYYKKARLPSENYIEENIENLFTLALTGGVTSKVKICEVTMKQMLASTNSVKTPGVNLNDKDSYVSYVPLSIL